jgi:hypothetical protein
MSDSKPMSWPVIIGILVATSLVLGVTLGLLHETMGLNPGAGVGAGIGIVGALLITRRRKALAAQKKS